MPPGLHLFGAVHLLILAAVPVLAALLARIQRSLGPQSRLIRYGLAAALLASTVAYYGDPFLHGERMFPGHVPLELCDASLWLVILVLITLRPALFDLVWYLAVAGAAQALLTPNLQEPSLFRAVQYFVDHGLLVACPLFLVWSGLARPRPGSVLRAMVALNVFALFVGSFDALFRTDYMFLRSKPPTASALDLLGPWPWYILACEPFALACFLLLWLPFRKAPGMAASELEEAAN